jgi:hypothetical protein
MLHFGHVCVAAGLSFKCATYICHLTSHISPHIRARHHRVDPLTEGTCKRKSPTASTSCCCYVQFVKSITMTRAVMEVPHQMAELGRPWMQSTPNLSPTAELGLLWRAAWEHGSQPGGGGGAPGGAEPAHGQGRLHWHPRQSELPRLAALMLPRSSNSCCHHQWAN